MGKQYTQKPTFQHGPDWHDLLAWFRNAEVDLGLNARLIIRPLSPGSLGVRVELYRVENEVRLGIAARERCWPHPSHKEIEGVIIWCMHGAYNDAAELTYQMTKAERARAGKR
jgi:hypothetical protein